MGGKAGGKQQVTDYSLSLHLGVAKTFDAITGIYVDKKTAWEGSVSTLEAIEINLPNLNGGPKQQGGLVGNAWYLPGAPDQVLPEALAKRLGRTAATCPAFRGVASVFFTGFGDTGPFLWTSNDPIVAQNVSVRGLRAPKGLDPTIAMMTTTVEVTTVVHTDNSSDPPTKTTNVYINGTDPGFAIYTDDEVTTETKTINLANGAHIIYEVLKDENDGAGIPAAQIDYDSFSAAASTLYNENLGISIAWDTQSSVEDFVKDVLKHIQGVCYQDPETGLWALTLLRADYDVSTLPVFTPDNATMAAYARKLWGETINELSVSWTNPLNEQTESITVQDIANIAVQGGVVSDSRDYKGIRTAALATVIGMRDLRSAVAPLRSMELKVNRSGWNLKPGKCVVVTWPEKRIANVVMRIGKIDRGKAGAPEITLTLLEDIFALDQAVITPAPSSQWVNTSKPPSPLDDFQIITLPAYFASTATLQSTAITLVYPEVLGAVLGYKRDRDAIGFDLFAEKTNSAGVTDFADVGTMTIVEQASIVTALAAEAVSTFPDSIVVARDRGPEVGQFVFFGDASAEIGLLTDLTAGVWTVQRGVLDTVPQAWAVGTKMWFVNAGARIVDEQVIRSAGEVVAYKGLTRSSQGLLPASSATETTHTMTARPHLPLRPANVQINGVGFGTVAIGSATALNITWATRNRYLEEGQAVLWTAGAVAPEYLQQTVITVTDVTGETVYYQQTGLWTDNALSLPASYFARWTDVYVTVSSLRDGLASLHGYTLHVSGLPGASGAALPPAPPAVTVAPSPSPAPASGAWTAVSSALTNGSGASIPVIEVYGTQDIESPAELVIQYAVHGETAWVTAPAIALTGLPIVSYLHGLVPGTAYDVRVAYRLPYGVSGTILSLWRNLGTFTPGDLVASATATVNGVPAATLVANLNGVIAAADALVTTYGSTASASASASAAAAQAAAALTYANIASSVGNVSLVVDPVFANWPSGAYPLGWSDWENGPPTSVTGIYSPHGMKVTGGAGAEGGVWADVADNPALGVGQLGVNDLVVLEADVKLESGSLIGSALYLNICDASGTYTQNLLIDFFVDSDVSGSSVGAGTVGMTYHFRKLAQITAAGSSQANLIAIAHFSGVGHSISAANSLTFYRASVRFASGAEIASGAAVVDAASALAATAAETTARESADAAIATSVSSLTTSLGTTNANVTSEAAARSTADTALGVRIDSLTTTVGGVSASVTNEASARASADSALGSRIDSVTASLGTTNANVTSEATARAAADATLATSISSVSSSLGSTNATVSTNATALATLSGQAYGSLTFTADSGHNVTGIRILSASGAVDVSAIKLDANIITFNGISPLVYDTTSGLLSLQNIHLSNAAGTVTNDLSAGLSIRNNGTVMIVEGLGFGALSNLLYWYGPSMAVSACTKANGIEWKDTSGNSYTQGTIFAGTLSTRAATSDTSASATAETAVFGSIGHTITVVMSYNFSSLQTSTYAPGTMSAFNTAKAAVGAMPDGLGGYEASGANSRTTTVKLYRATGGGAYAGTPVATLTLTGTWDWSGDPPNSVDPGGVTITCNILGSLTFTDPDLRTTNRQYKAVLTTRGANYTVGITQFVSVNCTEV